MKTALVVDDVAINRELLIDMLEDDYSVLEAGDGEEALRLIKEKGAGISVLLLDLIMPKLDGFGVLKGIKELGVAERFPVLIITGESDPESERKCLLEGATDFIKKPFKPTLVRQRVRNSTALFEYKNSLEMQVAAQTAEMRAQAEELARKNRILKKRNEDTVELLSSIVEARSLESGMHVKRVKLFTELLARKVAEMCPEYGLDEKQIGLMASASAMHDVGKISVPDAILNKPGKLTPEEFEEMKRHTLYGVKVLDETKKLWGPDYYERCREICLSHHERWDGRGYPEGRRGDEIPISAQIVSVADCFDALTTDRVYKKAFEPEQAYRMILNGECGSFGPRLMECFKECEESFALTAVSCR